jgi:hypothetical protein
MRVLALFALLTWSGFSQTPASQDASGPKEEPKRLPDGTLQSEAILKSDHKRTIEDLEAMKAIIQGIQTELEKNDHHVLSVGALRKLEDVEKRARRIRERLTRH